MVYRKINALIIVVILLMSTACNISNMYKGHPQFNTPSENWLKDSASDLDVKRAKLECGYTYLDKSVIPFSLKDNLFAYRCMHKAGFTYYRSDYNFCENIKDPKIIRLCNLPLSQIPDRDVNKRLNSLYCKKYAPNSPECRP